MPPLRVPARLRTFRLPALVLLIALGPAGLAAAGALSGAPAAAPAEAQPTQEEIRQLFEQQQYPQVLRKVARAMAVRGEAAGAYDRHDLLLLKAEAHLRLKAYAAAEQAFAAAARETRDEKLACLDLATAALVHRSRGGRYQPVAKANGRVGDAVSVVEPEARKAALEALFHDEWAGDAPRVAALRDTTSLDALLGIAPALAALRTLEVAATGGRDEQTRQLVSPLAKHAEDMMGDAEQDMIQKVDTITARANARDRIIVSKAGQGGPRGFSQQAETDHDPGVDAIDRRELAGVVAVCGKIGPAARALGEAMGSDGRRLIAISAAAEAIATKAREEGR